MANRITRNGARADFETTPDGVLVVRWGDFVTLRAADEVKQAICAALPVRPVGVVSDYSRAVVAMSDAELVRIMMGGQHDLPELPAAVIANAGMCRALYAASITAALAGQWRHVCRTAAEAEWWTFRHRLIQHAPHQRRAHVFR